MTGYMLVNKAAQESDYSAGAIEASVSYTMLSRKFTAGYHE